MHIRQTFVFLPSDLRVELRAVEFWSAYGWKFKNINAPLERPPELASRK